MGKEINKGLLCFFAGIAWSVGTLMMLPSFAYLYILAMPLKVRLGVSVLYSVVTLLLLYLAVRTAKRTEEETDTTE